MSTGDLRRPPSRKHRRSRTSWRTCSRTPYVIPSGPDALDATLGGGASTTGVAAGTAVTLSATFDDTRYKNSNGTEGSQNIAAGEYYVDTPPWATGAVAIAMSASDGTFDSTSEDATATVDTTDWTAGRHTLFVRAKDADENWGAVSAVFLFIGSAPPAAPATPTLTVGLGQLTVSWAEPAGNGSPITSYKLRYKRSDQHFGWSTVETGSSRETLITDLPANEPVEIQVRAVNAVGSSAWSTAATATPTVIGAPTLSVEDAEASESSGSMTFRVELSYRGAGPVRGYEFRPSAVPALGVRGRADVAGSRPRARLVEARLLRGHPVGE